MSEPKEYMVTWDIEIEAESPEEAAQIAAKIQRDPESRASFFRVRQLDSEAEVVVDVETGRIHPLPI